tara:strand:- start:30 stop:533 length:504 start_codon:yes stop_codon:yes gene_type:complete
MAPSEVVAIRWNDESTYEIVPIRPLSASSGRGLLSVSSHRAGQSALIILALDQTPNLEIYQWEDERNAPTLMHNTSVAPLPGSPRSIIRAVHPFQVSAGFQSWLARSEPEDQLWLLSVDTLGNSTWSQITEYPTLGMGVSEDGSIYSWYLQENTPGAQLGVWKLSQE